MALGLIVDNVKIVDLENLGTNENNKTEISIYPNPVNDYLNINSDKKISADKH